MGIADKSLILRHIRYFVAVADAGSLAEAARRIRIAQPSLSRQIQELEATIGIVLFHRDRRGVTLTSAGGGFLPYARAVIADLNEAHAQAVMAHRGLRGTLRVGLARIALHSPRVGTALSVFRANFPGVQLVVSEVSTLDQARALMVGQLDAAIGIHGSREDPSVNAITLYDDPIDSAALPVDHPLASRQTLEAADLRDLRFVTLDPAVAPALPELFEGFQRAGLRDWEPHDSIESMYSQVAAGRGWAHAPQSFRDNPPPGTVVREVRGLMIPTPVAIRRNASDDRPILENFVQAIVAAVRGSSEVQLPRAPATHERHALPQGLEFRHVRALDVAAEERSVREAAERLQLTASGLSRQISSLERVLGVALVDHQQSRFTLTAAGEVWRADAGTALDRLDQGLRAVRGVQATATMRCVIGSVPYELAGTVVSDAIRTATTAHPTLVVEVHELLTAAQVAALQARRIDLGIAGAFPSAEDQVDIAYRTLIDDVIDNVLVSANHPLAGRSLLAPSELAEFPFVFVSRTAYPKLFGAVISTFSELGLTPTIEDGYEGPRAMWRIVADSQAWTVGTRAMRATPPAGLVGVPVRGLQMPAAVHLLWRRDEQDPGVRAVLGAIDQSNPLPTRVV